MRYNNKNNDDTKYNIESDNRTKSVGNNINKNKLKKTIIKSN